MAKRNMPTRNIEEPSITIESTVVEEAQKSVVGIVSGCKRLNVRSKPSITAMVITEITVDSTVVISLEDSTNDWYKVCTEAGIEGFCMKKFVTVR